MRTIGKTEHAEAGEADAPASAVMRPGAAPGPGPGAREPRRRQRSKQPVTRCRMCDRGSLDRFEDAHEHTSYRCRHCEFIFTTLCDGDAGIPGVPGVRGYRRLQVYTPEGRWAVDPAFLCPALERLRDREPLRILDFGAADSIVPDLLRQAGHRVITLAPASAAVANVPTSGGHPDRIAGDILELNIPGAQFDLTYAYHALERLADPRPVLRELLRLTRPGGYLLVHGEMGGDAAPSRAESPAPLAEGVCCRFAHRTFEVFVRGSSHRVAHHDEQTVLIQRDADENG